jgi:nucleoid-associated protein YgaU
MYDLTLGGRCRCLLVWLLATAAAGLAVAWAAPDLAEAGAALRAGGPSGAPFDRLVVWLAAAALTGCAGWAWGVTGIVVAQALAGRPRAATPGVPRWLRSVLLLACGLAVVGAGSAAHAEEPHGDEPVADHREMLAGLPPPERVLGAARPSPAPRTEPARVHVVRAGDTLWGIAEADLSGRPDDARIAAHWQRIYRLNRAVIGPDPGLIHPGQEFRMPAPPTD